MAFIIVTPRRLLAVARRPRVAAAAGALAVSGAVSSASQLLVSGGLLEQAAGARTAYLAVILPSCVVAGLLMAGAAERRPVGLTLGLHRGRG
jgi:hypothetical protein